MYNVVCCGKRPHPTEKSGTVLISPDGPDPAIPRSTTSLADTNAKTEQVDPLTLVPPELMSEIFIKCLPDYTELTGLAKEAPVSVSQVNRAWRDVALSTPALWTTLVCQVDVWYCQSGPRYYDESLCYGHERQQGMPLHIWRLWSQRAMSYPLSAFLELASAGVDYDGGINQGYLEFISEQGRCWKELHVDVTRLHSATKGIRLIALDPAMSEQLEVLITKGVYLTVSPDGPYTALVPEGDLRSLTAQVFAFHTSLRHIDFHVDSNSIRDQHGVYDLRSTLAIVHGASSHLSSLSFSVGRRLDVAFPDLHYSADATPAMMPRLRKLILRDNITAARILLDSISTPALEDLLLEFCRDQFPSDPMTIVERDCLIAFLSRSGPPLTSLKLCVDGRNIEDVRRILSHVPQLKNLIVDTKGNEAVWTEKITSSFVDALKTEQICPLLEDVVLHHLPVNVNEDGRLAVVNYTCTSVTAIMTSGALAGKVCCLYDQTLLSKCIYPVVGDRCSK